MIKSVLAMSLALISSAAIAAPALYNIDPSHTYPSFEADHMGGLSVWRGKFRSSKGTVQLDREAKSGTIDIQIDTASVDFGHDLMNEHAKSMEGLFEVAKFPTATYKGHFSKFNGDMPAEVDGELTLHGVTKPVKLVINSFKCVPPRPPMMKTERCGADASTSFNRADLGINAGQTMGFKMDVKLAIQVEAAKAE
jgi:polyisoprenoid-binding protein YceI